MTTPMHIEKKAAQNKADLNQLQKTLGLKHFRVLIAPDVSTSADECIAGTLRLVKSIFDGDNKTSIAMGDLDAELV